MANPRWHLFASVAVLLACCCTADAAAASFHARLEGKLTNWQAGEGGYLAFGGPNLVVSTNGTLLSIMEGRKMAGDANGAHDIVLKRSFNNGTTWTALQVVHTESNASKSVVIGNPAVVVDRKTGIIWLAMCRNNTFVLMTSSSDHGASWAKPRDITHAVKPLDWGWYATTFSGIQLTQGPRAGRLIICCDHVDNQWTPYPITNGHSHIIYSDDAGASWDFGGSVPTGKTNECSVAELANGTVVLNARNYIGQSTNTVHRGIAYSEDSGMHWTNISLKTDLPDPVVFGDMIAVTRPDISSSEKVLLFTHPSSETLRANLTVHISVDAGASWSALLVIEPGFAQYSSLMELSNGSIAVQYDTGGKHGVPPTHETLAVFTLLADHHKGMPTHETLAASTLLV